MIPLPLVGDPSKREPLFSLTNQGGRTVSGISRWDGRYLDLDLSSVTGIETARLVLQTINRNQAGALTVQVNLLSNVMNPSAEAEFVSLPTSELASVGGATNFADLQTASSRISSNGTQHTIRSQSD